MPHSRNAKKRLRQNLKRRARNRSVKHAIKTQIKKALAAYKAGDLEALRKETSLAFKRLDRAACKRIVHPNYAARKKAQLSQLLVRLERSLAAQTPG
ncbi:MAG: 30S ribosomal protein S20 [Gemmatales bacterium]|nr:30S ribosomal protein S20 [Gemmatales bacterium]MDW7994827.1 30S ribosomal protein S20 [Gemmatales bacterium]